MEKSTPPSTKDSFWHYINPVCLSAGIIGLALHFEVEMLDLGMTGLGLGVNQAFGDFKKKGLLNERTPLVFMKSLKKAFWVVVMLALIGSLADMRSSHPVLFYGMVPHALSS